MAESITHKLGRLVPKNRNREKGWATPAQFLFQFHQIRSMALRLELTSNHLVFGESSKRFNDLFTESKN